MKIALFRKKPRIVEFIFSYEMVINAVLIFLMWMIFALVIETYLLALIFAIISVIIIGIMPKIFIEYLINSMQTGHMELKSDSLIIDCREENQSKTILFKDIESLHFVADYYLFHKKYKTRRSTGFVEMTISTYGTRNKYLGVITSKKDYEDIILRLSALTSRGSGIIPE